MAIFVGLVPLLLYGADKELKFLAEINVKKVKLLVLNQHSGLFPFYNRKGKAITRYVLNSMIAYYTVNTIGALILVIHFLTGYDLLFAICFLLFCSNPVLLIITMLRMSLLNKEQRTKRMENQMKSRS